MNIQGSINQLLVLGAAGIKSNKQLQEYRSAKKTAQGYEKRIDKELAEQEDYEAYAELKEKMYEIYPSERRFQEASDAHAEALFKQKEREKQQRAEKQRQTNEQQKQMAKRRSAEEAAAKAQEDLINRQNERMRKDKSSQINFGSFIEGGIDG